jgi:hypothetical protein
MTIFKPTSQYKEIYLSNPKDVLVHKVRSMMVDIDIKGSHKIDLAPQYYTGVAVLLENSFMGEVASTIPISKQTQGFGDYDG